MTPRDWAFAVGFVAMGFFHVGLYGAVLREVWRSAR
jgi:hypothetical protein